MIYNTYPVLSARDTQRLWVYYIPSSVVLERKIIIDLIVSLEPKIIAYLKVSLEPKIITYLILNLELNYN